MKTEIKKWAGLLLLFFVTGFAFATGTALAAVLVDAVF